MCSCAEAALKRSVDQTAECTAELSCSGAAHHTLCVYNFKIFLILAHAGGYGSGAPPRVDPNAISGMINRSEFEEAPDATTAVDSHISILSGTGVSFCHPHDVVMHAAGPVPAAPRTFAGTVAMHTACEAVR